MHQKSEAFLLSTQRPEQTQAELAGFVYLR